ncbi:Hypothetical predicted protein [Marmota monax]|uniref:Uncharacterized protein n=1 Tax=Marmota monax TaxID=9995 RepID=A0A5E4DD13_MARMO|nr:Hypothetical predicted protein [Marmota monax]
MGTGARGACAESTGGERPPDPIRPGEPGPGAVCRVGGHPSRPSNRDPAASPEPSQARVGKPRDGHRPAAGCVSPSAPGRRAIQGALGEGRSHSAWTAGAGQESRDLLGVLAPPGGGLGDCTYVLGEARILL